MERLGDNPPKFVSTLIEVGQHKLVDIEKLINEKRVSKYIPMAKTKKLF